MSGGTDVTTSELAAAWRVRGAVSKAMIESELAVRSQLRNASAAELASLLESFAPTMTSGRDWSLTFVALIEHIWAWCDDDVIEEVRSQFAGRGPAWASVTNSLDPGHGQGLRERLQARSGTGPIPLFMLK